jgi:hypothetical protein
MSRVYQRIQEAIEEYQPAIYGGVIVSAGKFEGQKSEVLYFYSLAMDGHAVRQDLDIDLIELDKEETEYFQTKATHYQLTYHDLGFVSGQFLEL